MLDGRFVKEIHQEKNLDLHEEKSMGKSDRNKKDGMKILDVKVKSSPMRHQMYNNLAFLFFTVFHLIRMYNKIFLLLEDFNIYSSILSEELLL